MAGNNVNLNQGLDFINKYLKDLGIDKKVTSSEVASIFKDLEKNEDGTVNTSDFALAVANAYGNNQIDSIEEEYLDAWEAISGIDGNNESISAEDIAGLETSVEENADAASEASGGSGGGGGGGGAVPSGSPTGQNDNLNSQTEPVSSVPAANITGNESVEELQAGRSDALAQLSEMQAQKYNNEAVIEAEQAVAEAQTTYTESMEAFEENAAELYKKVADTQERKEKNDQAISGQKSVIDTVKGNISAKEGEINALTVPPETITETDPETGETVSKPNPDYQEYLNTKAALEAELADLQTELANQETTLANFEKEGELIDSQLAEILNSQEMQENEYAKAAKDAFMAYIDAQSNLSIVKAEQTAQVDADIAQLRENVSAYDTAIEQAEAQETQEEQEAEEAEEVVLQPEEEECVGDPIGFEFKDENGNPVDLKLIKDDGNFDSVSDFLGSTTAGISELTELANKDGIVDAEALKKGEIKFATVVDGELKTYTFEDLQETYGISDIQIDVSKLDPNYKEEQEFGVTVNFAEQEAQEVTGYSDFKTAEEIRAMEGYSDLIGDYDDTYRDENDVLINLPEQFRGSEYAEYIHVDENGNYYINIDVDNTWNINKENEQHSNGESLDEIITELYSLDTQSPDYKTTLASLKAAIKVANSAEQKSSASSSAEGDIYIYEATGTISSNLTKDGAKLLLVDKDAALELIPVGSEWYDLSEGNPAYRGWAKEAAAETDLIQELTANQGFTRDSEGRKVLDEGGEEFSNLLQSLTSDVVDEDGTVISTPEKVWANADFSQYSPETVLKLAQAFENNVEADGRTFIEAAKYYCGNGQAEDELIAVTDAIMSKAGNEQAALDMITKEIESALDNGDVDSITRLLNAAKENQSDMQIVLQQFEINNGVSLSSTLEELELNEEDLADYNKIITECENTVSNDMLDIINKLGSSVDGAGTTLSGVAEKAWEELDVSNMTPSELLKLQQGYDSIYGEGSFLERAEQLYQGSTFDRIMNAVDTIEVDSNVTGYTKVNVNGTEQSINDFIKSLDYASGVNNLESLSDEDIANVASVYDGVNGEGSFKAFMESGQTEYDPSKLYEIEQKLQEAEFEATKEPDAASITLTEEEVTQVVEELLNKGAKEWQEFDFSIYSQNSIISIATAYQNQISENENGFYEQALYYLGSGNEDMNAITNALLSESADNTEIKEIFADAISGKYAANVIEELVKAVEADKFLAYNTKEIFEEFETASGESIAKYAKELDPDLDRYTQSINDIMQSFEISEETKAHLEALTSEDINIQKETWMAYLDNNLTDEELLNLVNTFEYIYGEGSFLETARIVSNSIYAENGETPIFDSIINNIYDNQEKANVYADINYTHNGTTYATAQDLANALEQDSSLWSEIAFEEMDPQVLASVAKAYGVELFTKEFIRNNYDSAEITLYSELKVQVENAYANKEISADECVDYADLAKTETAEILFANIDSLIAEYNAIDDVIDLTPQEKEMKKRDIQDYIASAFCEALIQDEITINEKMNLFKKLTDEYPSVVETFISNSEYIISGDTDEGDEVVKVVDVINNMIEDINTPEQAIEFAQLFDQMSLAGYGSGELLNYLYNNTSNKQTYIDSITRIYSLATPEQIAQLNELFPSKKLFQDPYSMGTEDEIIKELFATMIEKLPEVETVSDAENKYNIDEDFDRSIYLKDSAELTISEILKNYSNNNLSANEAIYLIVTCGYDTEEIALGFRSLYSDEEEKYLPIFLELFANVNI